MVGPAGYHKKGPSHLALFAMVAFAPPDKQTDAVINRMASSIDTLIDLFQSELGDFN